MYERNRSSVHISVLRHFLEEGPQDVVRSRVAINSATRIPLDSVGGATRDLLDEGLLSVHHQTPLAKVIGITPTHEATVRAILEGINLKN